MEAVKATIPRTLLQHIDASQIGDVEVTCSALASHFKSSATCSQVLVEAFLPISAEVFIYSSHLLVELWASSSASFL